MQINSMRSLYPSFLESTESSPLDVNQSEKESTSPSSSVKTKPSYDLHNMSLNEFKGMLKEMHDEGALSPDDFVRFETQEALWELFSGYSADDKLDILSLMQNDVDYMSSYAFNSGAEYDQTTLDLLKGIDARMQASIPSFV